jgi:hypothetical protein
MSALTAPPAGLARLPTSLRRLVEEAATNANTAAGLLADLARYPRRALGLRADIAECEAEGDRIVHDAVRQPARARSLGPERARLHDLIEAVDDVVDAVDDAAHDIAAAASLVAPARSTAIASLSRDLVRTTMRTVPSIEEAPDCAPCCTRARMSFTASSASSIAAPASTSSTAPLTRSTPSAARRCWSGCGRSRTRARGC